MKSKNFLFLVAAVVLVAFTSCKKDDDAPDLAKKVVSTYNGTFNSTNHQSTDYDVFVTKVSNDKIKIAPEDNNGTSFEVTIKESNGTYASTTNAVSFREINGVMTLSYEISNVEQFTGGKK